MHLYMYNRRRKINILILILILLTYYSVQIKGPPLHTASALVGHRTLYILQCTDKRGPPPHTASSIFLEGHILFVPIHFIACFAWERLEGAT